MATTKRLFWLAGIAGIVIAMLAGTAVTIHARRPPQLAISADPLQEAAQKLRDEPSAANLARLDELYAGMCDPATGEPLPQLSGAGLRGATDALRDASDAHPDDAALHRIFGQYLLVGGLTASAVKELQAAAQHGEDPVKVTLPLAFALLRADRLEDLLALPIPPEATPHPRVLTLMARARALEAMNRIPDANSSLQQAFDSEPRDLEVIVSLGLLYLSQGDHASAGRWLDQATAIEPDATATLRLRGEYGYAVGDYAGSAAAYGKLVAANAPGRYDPLPPILGLARARTYLGDLAGAADALDHSQIPGNDPTLGYYRALLAYRSGDFRRATDLAEPLVGKMANFPGLYLLLGGAALASGFPETARHYLERYVDAVPSNRIAQTLLEEAIARAAQADEAKPVARGLLYSAFGFTVTPADATTAR
jgi:cellulose synthase operon protein C